MAMERLVAFLPAPRVQQLTQRAHELGITTSEYVRRIVDAHFGPPAKEERHP